VLWALSWDLGIHLRTYIYIAYIRVWMYRCCCFTHWLSDLCEIRLNKSAQSGADYLWVSCISAHGRQ
jgi:hypothetical protein